MSVATPKRSPTLHDVMQGAISSRLLDLHTALPGRVERYDAAKQQVDVKPLVKLPRVQEDGSVTFESIPMVNNVPVVFPGGGGFRATFPIAKGETVLLLFAESSLDTWLATGGEVSPEDVRRHHFSDGVAIPTLRPFSSPWTGASSSDATLGKDGGPQVVLKALEIHLGAKDGTPATQALILGTYFRAQQVILHTALSGSLAAMATALTAAGTALSSMGTDPVFVAAAPAAAGFAVTAGGSIATAAGAATAMKAAVDAFEAANTPGTPYVSGTVKTV